MGASAASQDGKVMIRLCILDFDGTLCGTHEAIAFCLNRTFDLHRQPRPSTERLEAAIKAGVVMVEAVVMLTEGRLHDVEAQEWATTYRTLYREHGLERSILFPSVKEGLERMKDKGRSLVIASNKAAESVATALEHYEIAQYIDLSVCDPKGIPKKPDPASYTQIIAPTFPQVMPAEIVVVGDTHADLGLARNIGALSCWAGYGYGNQAACLSMKPDMVIEAFSELVAGLDSLDRGHRL
jgi:phosphoglycolate phosphatase